MSKPPTERFSFQSMNVYRSARELVVVVQRGAIGDPELRDQATRAAKSVLLNLAEGLPLDAAGMRRRHFSVAYGSLHEVIAAVDVADALGAIDPAVAGRAMELAAGVRRMLRGLMH